MSDSTTNIQQLRDLLLKFRDDRNWSQFHDPKNLATAISIEANELQEHFLWKSLDEINKKLETDIQFKQKVSDELADVVIFCLNFANATNIDVSDVVQNKIDTNNKKYPVEKSAGTAKKYNEL